MKMTGSYYHPDTGAIIEAQKTSRDAKRSGDENQLRIDDLEDRCEKLAQISEALWHLLSNHLKIDSELLKQQLLTTVDIREARKTQKQSCSNCSQLSPTDKLKCMYCGYESSDFQGKSIFDI